MQTTDGTLAGPRLPLHDPGTPTLSVVDMHTGEEPLRIVVGGCPEVVGPTLLAKRRYMRQHLDYVRRWLMYEPRGHWDMYGAVLVPSELPDAHPGVLFLHNEGYSSMCGHAVLALGRFALDFGLVPAPPAGAHEACVNIHCLCGLVATFVECEGSLSCDWVHFHSVLAFVLATDFFSRCEFDRHLSGDRGQTFHNNTWSCRMGPQQIIFNNNIYNCSLMF